MKQYVEIVRNLFRVAGRRHDLSFLLLGSSAAYNLAGLLPPLATAGIVRVVTEGEFEKIWGYVGMYVGFYALYFGFLRLNNYAYTKMAEFYHISLQERLFRAVDLRPEILEKVPRGRVMDTFADDVRWMVDGVNVATEALLQGIRLAIIFGIFLLRDVRIGVMVVMADVLYLLVLNGNAREEARRYGNARKAEDRAISAFSEMVSVREEAQRGRREELGILGVASEERVEAAEALESGEQWAAMEKSFPGWKREYRKKRRAIANRNTVWAAMPYAGKVALYVVLAKMVIEGAMGLDGLVLLVGYFEMTITCMDTMTDRLLELSNYGVRVERLKKIL